jgi:thiamine biosynthesis lipoprotein
VSTHVFETMGTVVSIAFRGEQAVSAILSEVEDEFASWNDRYSLYRPESELSRVASGRLALVDASAHLRDTYRLAIEWRARTRGAFTAHRPDGVLDLSGVVKAAAMDSAGAILESAGILDWAINVGGDLLTAPGGPGDVPWRVGIADPAERGELLTAVMLGFPRRACATSGSAERGDHIWRTGASADFSQATVLADDIITADVLATAVIAGGGATLDLLTTEFDIDVVTVSSEGELRMTPGAVRAMNLAGA